jgi:flagellar biosynthesis anti-sigma factor FlgM
MKIGSGTPTANLDPRLLSQQQASGELLKDDEKAKDAAKVTLSQSATTLSAIQDELAKVPEVRSEKVEQIRSEIEAGTYYRSPDAIANKMIVSSLVDSLYQK